MSLEQGLYELVQGDSTVASLASTGGYFGTLPKGTGLPSWAYTTVARQGTYTLGGKDGLVCKRLQIDCFGRGDPALGPADAVQLATAITNVLDDFRGTLPNNVQVQWIQQIGEHDFFDTGARSYRRALEFYIRYAS